MPAPIPERHPDRSTRTEEAMSETPLSRVRAFQRAANPNGDYHWPAEEAANVGGVPLYFDDIEALASTDDLDAVEVAIRRLRETEAARDAATVRAERAEVELKKLESVLEDACEQVDKARDERDAFEEALARVRKQNAELIAAWKQGNGRRTSTAPHADLERLAREQGVQPVRSIDQLTAPEGERVSDEEWTAYADALGIETGGEQGDGRDHTFEMLDDDAPKQNPRAVAEYWHEWADTCSNGGCDDEWTTVAQVVGRILAAMDGEQGEREGGGDA